MKYAILNHYDNEDSKSFLRAKGITKEHMYQRTQLRNLVPILRKGDKVYVANINRFDSVTQFCAFAGFCVQNGIEFHSLCQPYLDLKDGQHWKESYMEQMKKMKAIENEIKKDFSYHFVMTQQQWDFLFHDIEIMNLEILATMFSKHGCLSRSRS